MSRYQAFKVVLIDQVAQVCIARADKRNAMNEAFWQEIVEIFRWIDDTDEVRAVVLSGEGAHFSAGIDLTMLASLAAQMGQDAGRNARLLRKIIKRLQEAFNAVDRCSKPVLAAIQGHCIGGAGDLIAACDMRYCSMDARFSIKEVDMGMAADVGTLQRLPRIIGDGILRELAFTGRDVEAAEALRIGLVNRCFDDLAALIEGVQGIAREIAQKSPLAVAGTKRMLDYARDHSVEDGLEYIATWNAAMLQSEDLRTALAASLSKQVACFND